MSEQIATYTFLPWLRQGIASKIEQQDDLGSGTVSTERASVRVSLQVNGDDDFVSKDVQLVGSGDVVGISPRAIVRTEPRNWVTDFEPNYLAFVEFYDEDFPWRYTPARAVEVDSAGTPVSDPQRTKLRPWLSLMVLEEGELEQGVSLEGPLPIVRLSETADPADIFPPPDQAWAWAHVHVSKDITDGNTHTAKETVDALEDLVRRNPDEALSRLVCPRKLKPSTGYHAFLIPAFEVGRLAGLGMPTAGDALAPAWGGDGQNEYPVYHQWYFRTGQRGDFEYLVNLLEARPVDERVGIRDMDMQKPDFGVPGMINGPNDIPVMGLEGALKSPEAQPRPEIWPPADPADFPDFLKELGEQVNLQDTLLNPPDSSEGHPDPVISPPLYGRWHARQRRLHLGQDGWVNELNQDTRYRGSAGFGTQVIRTNQETYMQKAWQQLGDVLQANQKIRQAQLSIAASHRVFVKHLLPLTFDQQIAITQQVHPRVLDNVTTLSRQVKDSRLPQAALTPALHKMLRPRGAVMRKAVPESRRKPTDLLTRLNEGRITAAPPKEAPSGQLALDAAVKVLVEERDLPGAIRLSEANLTTAAVKLISGRPKFFITDPGQQQLPPDQSGGQDSPEATNFRAALLDLHTRFETPLPQPEEKPQLDFTAADTTLVATLNPVYAIPRRLLSVVAIPETFKYLRPFETIVPVMAHPVFPDPMYKPLRDISSERLIPNLNLIPNNTISLLETNPRFIESYMVGLNHEMARELLWREYLTDQRGSYFRQFWDVSEIVNRDEEKDTKTLEEEQHDITPLHTWGRLSRLGTHKNRELPTGSGPGESLLVLAIRGDLLKKYPTAVIYAQRAKWTDDSDDPSSPPRKIRVLDETNPEDNIKEPIFKAAIEPDLRFIGFNLTASAAKGDPTPPTDEDDPGNPGWFFDIQQQPGESRFGLDIEESTPPTPTEWNKLAWNHLGDPAAIKFIDLSVEPTVNIPEESPDKQIEWGTNAADMAYILYQTPVMVAVHADDMLE